MNSSSRILCFNGFLWIFRIFYFGQYVSVLPLGSISWAMHLYFIWFSWKGQEPFSIAIKINWNKIDSYNFMSLAYSYKDKCMLKVTSDHNKKVIPFTLFIMKSLLKVHKLALEVLSFLLWSACVKDQLVDMNIQGLSWGQKFRSISRIPNGFKIIFFLVENIFFPILW